MRLRFAPRARNDIDEIAAYIAKHNPRAASAVVAKIRATAQSVARQPGLGRRTLFDDIRVIRAGHYPSLMYYRIGQREVAIIHVRHGRRDDPTRNDLA
jgi:plasmid stabilization system protein ParE